MSVCELFEAADVEMYFYDGLVRLHAPARFQPPSRRPAEP